MIFSFSLEGKWKVCQRPIGNYKLVTVLWRLLPMAGGVTDEAKY